MNGGGIFLVSAGEEFFIDFLALGLHVGVILFPSTVTSPKDSSALRSTLYTSSSPS